MVGAYPICGDCGSRDVVRDAWAEWNFAVGDWQLKTTFDQFTCDGCGENITLIWRLDEAFRTQRIARLNDALRRGEGEAVTVVITSGVQAIGREFLHEVNHAVATFEDFSEGNDPHKEHDFGAVDVQGEKLFWKVDYFDPSLSRHSCDAADPTKTHRVLTIMLASEY
ncbi:MAG: DUF3768 domain-containing protein [Rhodobacteraceae bacterium]|nr:DUF3768 domain-containing protein [Paracoccaceae bacterium]